MPRSEKAAPKKIVHSTILMNLSMELPVFIRQTSRLLLPEIGRRKQLFLLSAEGLRMKNVLVIPKRPPVSGRGNKKLDPGRRLEDSPLPRAIIMSSLQDFGLAMRRGWMESDFLFFFG
jgi:hypothetical protein